MPILHLPLRTGSVPDDCVTFCLQWVGEKQKEFNVNSMQLLYYQAPLSAFLLLFVIPFFEPVVGYGGVLHYWPPKAVVCILLEHEVPFYKGLNGQGQRPHGSRSKATVANKGRWAHITVKLLYCK